MYILPWNMDVFASKCHWNYGILWSVWRLSEFAKLKRWNKELGKEPADQMYHKYDNYFHKHVSLLSFLGHNTARDQKEGYKWMLWRDTHHKI